ncbi:MAG: WHG domain-containing protein [Alphaproteobacteria bacterium]
MARRQEHTPEELRAMICGAAEKIVAVHGLPALTARRLAQAIGYAPGTIYNIYTDMNALIMAVNTATLQRLHDHCLEMLRGTRPGFARVRRLAHAYIDFARVHELSWRALFITGAAGQLPESYRQIQTALFQMIESTLRESLLIPRVEAAEAARLLWASLHGITVLELDGRLALVGAPAGDVMADDLLRKYLAKHIKQR